MVESDTARVSVLPLESDTARVSALPVIGIEVPAVYFGKVALDSVGLRVGPSCLRLDPEEALPASLDERGVTCDVYLGVTLDGGPMEGAPVLEPLEHSVLEKSPVGGFTEGAPVLVPLENSVPDKALDDRLMVGVAARNPLGHSVFDVDMISLWNAPWDAGGMFRIRSRSEMAIRRDRLRCVVQYFRGLARTGVIDLYTGVLITLVGIMVEDQKPDFLALARRGSQGRGYGYSPGRSSMTDLGFPWVSCSLAEMCTVDSNFPRVSCSPVEMCAVDSNFLRSSFSLGELCAERLDYIRRASVTGLPVNTQTVTGSLLFGSPHRLVWGASYSTLFLHRWTDELEVLPVGGRWTWVCVQSGHAYLFVTFDCFFFSSGLIDGTVITTTGILLAHGRLVLCRYRQCLTYSGTLAFVFFCCLVLAGFWSSDVSAAMEQAGPSSASSASLAGTFLRLSLDLASDQLYDLPVREL